MSCLQVHDFITGTTITLPHGGEASAGKGKRLDIVRPNGGADALVADHLARITAMSVRRTKSRRSSKITAVAC